MDGGGGQYTDGDGLAYNTTDLVRRALGELTSAMPRLLVQVEKSHTPRNRSWRSRFVTRIGI